MKLPAVAAYAVASAVLLVAAAASSSTGAYPDAEARNLDLLASAQPGATETFVRDTAFDEVVTGDRLVKADAAATTSATCDGCAGESAALQVVYVSRANLARLDNSAVAWTQSCQDCTGTALSVQVVVLPSRSVVRPNNRAVALNAECTVCRTAALAFQVVVVDDEVGRLSAGSMADLKLWAGEQAAALRTSVGLPPPDPSSTPTADATGQPTSPAAQPTGDATPTTDATDPTDATSYAGRRAKRTSTTALAELEQLVTTALDAEVVVSDVDLRR